MELYDLIALRHVLPSALGDTGANEALAEFVSTALTDEGRYDLLCEFAERSSPLSALLVAPYVAEAATDVSVDAATLRSVEHHAAKISRRTSWGERVCALYRNIAIEVQDTLADMQSSDPEGERLDAADRERDNRY